MPTSGIGLLPFSLSMTQAGMQRRTVDARISQSELGVVGLKPETARTPGGGRRPWHSSNLSLIMTISYSE